MNRRALRVRIVFPLVLGVLVAGAVGSTGAQPPDPTADRGPATETAPEAAQQAAPVSNERPATGAEPGAEPDEPAASPARPDATTRQEGVAPPAPEPENEAGPADEQPPAAHPDTLSGSPESVPPLPTPPPAPPPAQPPPVDSTLKRLRTIAPDEAAGVLGKKVLGAAGEDIGMVVDVLIDSGGHPRAAVIDFGGFLGVGSRKIAVDWKLLQFRPGDRSAPVLLDVTRDAIQAAPEYRPTSDTPRVVVAPPEPSAEPERSAAPEAPAETAAPEPSPVEQPAAAADRAQPPSEEAPPEAKPEPAPADDQAPGTTDLQSKIPKDKPKRSAPAASPPPGADPGPPPATPAPATSPDARQ